MNQAPPAKNVIDLTRPLGSRPLQDADYRLMVEAVTDYAIFFLDVNGLVRSWNAGARLLKGYEAEEVIGKPFSMFYPQELIDRRWHEHELAEATRTGRFEDEGWRVRKDGTRFWANIVITRLLGPNGELRGFSKITRNLTDRRAAEEVLRSSEERFRLLVDNVRDYAIFMLDLSGHIVSWNKGAEMTTGYVAAEVLGRHFSMFYPPNLAATGAPQHELDVARTLGKFRDEGWRVRKDGSRFWSGVVLTAVIDDQGRHRGYAKVTRDLTERRKVSALEDEGRRINTFLAMLGHELRNPLAAVSNAVSLMHRDAIESPTFKTARDVIERQMRQLTRLVDDLLDVSRITSGKIRLERKPVHLHEVITQAVETVQPLLREKGHQLTVNHADAELWSAGDRARLVQVVTNLLNNAAKFTPRGGRIDIETLRSNGRAEIRVRDNGPGIPDTLLPEIFELFVQGEQSLGRTNGGLGLGLPLVRQLVRLHEGEITAYSKGVAGAGSEFVVHLPLMSAPTRAGLPQRSAQRRILVVDDNRDSADTMSLLMQGLGYETATAYDGESAITMALAHPPDAVLLDIGLPGISGLEVARQLIADMVDPPKLIAVSGYGQEADREASLKAGFTAHLAKPVDIAQVTTLLKQLLS